MKGSNNTLLLVLKIWQKFFRTWSCTSHAPMIRAKSSPSSLLFNIYFTFLCVKKIGKNEVEWTGKAEFGHTSSQSAKCAKLYTQAYSRLKKGYLWEPWFISIGDLNLCIRGTAPGRIVIGKQKASRPLFESYSCRQGLSLNFVRKWCFVVGFHFCVRCFPLFISIVGWVAADSYC